MSVRNPIRRIEKWDMKFAGDVLSEKQKTLKPSMKIQIDSEYPSIAKVETEIKVVLGKYGIPTWHNPAYLACGRELYRLQKRFSGQQLINAVQPILLKWQARELRPEILEEIRNTVFTVMAPTP